MLTKNLREEIEQAIIPFPRSGRMGVLVGGGLIVAAARCIRHTEDGLSTFGHFVEKIQTASGEINVVPVILDPINDIAVLGSPELFASLEPRYSEDVLKFDRFCKETRPVRVCRRDYGLHQEYPVSICTDRGNWIAATVVRHNTIAPGFVFYSNTAIDKDAAGSQVFNECGELVGTVVFETEKVAEDPDVWTGITFCPRRALPLWICQSIFGEAYGGEGAALQRWAWHGTSSH